MNFKHVRLRVSDHDDRDRILAVHLDAFGGDEGPVIVNLLEEVLDDPTAKPMHSFVAELNDEIVGHVLFTSVTIEPVSQTDGQATAQILAPLAVPSELHGKGIGTHLVKESLLQLAASGVQLVFVLGYPNYYSRFGFVPAGARGLQAPYPIPEKNADAWMVLELEADAAKSVDGTVKCCSALDHQKYWVE
ncbi:GNAT family N-acetyltransferase [Roseiconus lacunae]|uniref:GNAT family N-acetyltransferase n=1 Tax=Roseiconus lacunae TaxID=2605694 RepID=UPI001E40869A|nr:N-acetyltransferase [Roseiconus lacunae]MCD0462340.1 N-acetyltransferase [Roseiconus lacunae]